VFSLPRIRIPPVSFALQLHLLLRSAYALRIQPEWAWWKTCSQRYLTLTVKPARSCLVVTSYIVENASIILEHDKTLRTVWTCMYPTSDSGHLVVYRIVVPTDTSFSGWPSELFFVCVFFRLLLLLRPCVLHFIFIEQDRPRPRTPCPEHAFSCPIERQKRHQAPMWCRGQSMHRKLPKELKRGRPS